MEIKKEFEKYKNKKVFVTGDTGFKGSWLCLWLKELGAEVCGYSLPPLKEEDHYNVVNLKDEIIHIDGDIRDFEKMKKAIEDFKPEIVFHLAAQPLVRLSYEEPKSTFETNVIGSVNLLEIVRHIDYIKSVVYITTDKCYQNKEWIWGYRENDELGGKDPYSASKAMAELAFYSYNVSYFEKREGFGIASVRAGNVIGGGDWSDDRIVPDCIRSIKNNKPILLRNPMAVRPWQHVLEPLSGYMLLGLKLLEEPKKYSGSWNFGPENDSVQTVGQLAEKIVSIMEDGKIVVENNYTGPHEANLLRLNCDKAHQLLNWKPKWDYLNTMQSTVEWYKRFLKGENSKSVSIEQIRLYMEDK